jgi:membrane protein implicated in regulation of membrane protease activity
VTSEDDEVVGKVGIVVHPVAPGRTGEVQLHVRGATEIYMAISDSELDRHGEALVIAHVAPRTVRVTPFLGGSTVRYPHR